MGRLYWSVALLVVLVPAIGVGQVEGNDAGGGPEQVKELDQARRAESVTDVLSICVSALVACAVVGLAFLLGRRIDRLEKRVEGLEKKGS